MSRQATEHLIAAFVEAFNRADNAAVLALLYDDIAFDMGQGGREIGVEKFRWLIAAGAAHCKEQMADAVVLSSEDGMRGAVDFTSRGTYVATIEGMPKASGQRYALQAATLFEVDDGKITRLTSYRNMQEWIRQISEE